MVISVYAPQYSSTRAQFDRVSSTCYRICRAQTLLKLIESVNQRISAAVGAHVQLFEKEQQDEAKYEG
jgi:hypothetical protein